MLLIVISAAIVVFVVVIILLAIAAINEQGQMRRIRFDPSARPFTLTLTEAFDPEHVVMWSTQIPALEFICAAGNRGVNYARLYPLFLEDSRRFPELYEGSSFAQWLQFLHNSDLVTMMAHRVKITAYGRQFLDYCKTETTLAA